MLYATALCLAVLGALSAAVIKDVKLGDSVTLPCKHHENKESSLEQLDVQWWLGKELVIGLDRGRVSYGLSYMNRTELPAGGARDFSLTITHTQHGDSGVYRCVILTENQEEPLEEVQLRVKVPRYPSAEFIKVGEDVVLPCFGRVDWFNSEAELVRWIRGDQMVLQWEKGSLYVHPQFKHRASLLKTGILKDNLSLVLKNSLHEDQGLYFCKFVNNQTIRTGPQINLTVTDHLSKVKAELGSSVLLPLHSACAVSVRFLPDGGNSPVQVCEVKAIQVTCEAAYTPRTTVPNTGSLELKILLTGDSGTFSVMERQNQRTVSVLILEVFTIPPSLFIGERVVKVDTTSLVIMVAVFVLMAVLVVVITLEQKRWSQWWKRYIAHNQSHNRGQSDEESTSENEQHCQIPLQSL